MWNILIVDDNFTNRKLLMEILKTRATCAMAANGKEAIEAYDVSITQNKPYDLILLDVAMPEVDGLQVLETIRAREASRHVPVECGIPVIMVTVHRAQFIKAFSKGCDDYILKPIDEDELIRKIEEKLIKKPQ